MRDKPDRKKSISPIIILLFLSFFAYSKWHGRNQNVKKPTSTKTYSCDLISFNYPSDWVIDDDEKQENIDKTITIVNERLGIIKMEIMNLEWAPSYVGKQIKPILESGFSRIVHTTSINKWGSYHGHGFCIKGFVQNNEHEQTLSAIAFQISNKVILVTEISVSEYMSRVNPFFSIVRNSFTHTDDLLQKTDIASTNLIEARKRHKTVVKKVNIKTGELETPSAKTFLVVKYPSPIGDLSAYISPDPGDGQRHPALLWATGGFGGIGAYLGKQAPANNDQSVRAYLRAGIVVMCPSFRGDHDNPGQYEMFYGEVDDFLAARDYLAKLPYVDPNRIYIGGHSTGGTMTLLASVATEQFRAAFSFGGAPDIAKVVSDGRGYGNTPFDYRSKQEGVLRSAIYFVRSIKRPTFYFEGEESEYCLDTLHMQDLAVDADVPFEAFIVEGGNHFNILAPINKIIAKKIIQDTGDQCNISFTDQEIQKLRYR